MVVLAKFHKIPAFASHTVREIIDMGMTHKSSLSCLINKESRLTE
jgi:hypothetical protein